MRYRGGRRVAGKAGRDARQSRGSDARRMLSHARRRQGATAKKPRAAMRRRRRAEAHLDGTAVRRVFPGHLVLGPGVFRRMLSVVMSLVPLPVAAGGGHRGWRGVAPRDADSDENKSASRKLFERQSKTKSADSDCLPWCGETGADWRRLQIPNSRYDIVRPRVRYSLTLHFLV